jgi:GGDEF domain-containing protein
MYERSPFTLADFVRQRRHWFGGLWLCALAPNIPLAQRLVLMSFMGLWSISWFCIFMVFFNIVYPTGTPLWLGVTGGLSFSYYVLLYVIGYIRSFDWRGAWGVFLWRGLLQIALIPVFSALEGAGVIYGLVAPPKDFYVVHKLAPVYQRPASARLTGLRPAFQALRFRLLGVWRRMIWFPTYLHIRAQAGMRRLDQRDTATGLLTYAYWLYALHIERGGTSSRSRDVVCVNLTVRGLEPVRATHGQAAADQVMQQIGAALMANIRPYDLACRPQPGQIMLALIDCSPEFGAAATQRLAGTLNRQVLSALNERLGSRLSLGYHTAPIPKGRLTFDALYRLVQLFHETWAVKASSRVVA